MALPDVQSWKPNATFKLTRVGIKGIKKPVCIERNGRIVNLIPAMDLFVDLPASRKGSDLSRNAEIIEEIVDESTRQPSPSLEDLCERIAEKLLLRHEYASCAEVIATSEYFLERVTPAGKKTVEPYKIMARAIKEREGKTRKFIGVEVTGMTACPCAMENIKKTYNERYTHNQRNVATLIIENDGSIDADDLIDIAEKAMSSPTYEILKRMDEMEVVKRAHENPKFVEDVVRDMLKQILERYPDLPDYIMVIARSESLESIHKHNAYAERITTVGELRK
ncbi:MAG: GTP cyclohydrolase I FolE2 [Thermoplasmata archaeon]|nr:MAG: GTP cyclohydrolase I FolE2 [Thermoplasmata archaeon]HDN96270.1 GTP cyclohydrolase I FolE2 [Thermoplasmatales archaeon]